MTEAQDYEAVRRRVEVRFQHRYAFYSHVAAFTLVNMVLWVVWLLTSGMAWQIADRFPIISDLYTLLAVPWPLIVMGGWGIGLVAHGLNYYIRYGGGAMRREVAIQREIEREMALNIAYEKPKNDVPMRLTDDGELEEVPMADRSWSMKRKRQ